MSRVLFFCLILFPLVVYGANCKVGDPMCPDGSDGLSETTATNEAPAIEANEGCREQRARAAQQGLPDYVIRPTGLDFEVRLYNLTAAATSEIDAIEQKSLVRLQLAPGAGQGTLAELVRFKWLEDLEIMGNACIHSLAPIAELTNLRRLKEGSHGMSLRDLAPFDLGPVGELKRLEAIDITRTVVNTQALAGLTRLEEVYLRLSDKATSIDFLRTTPGVRDLEVVAPRLWRSSFTFSDYRPLGSLRELRDLTLHSIQATDQDLAPLLQLASLERIELKGNGRVTSLGFLARASGLRRVAVEGCSRLADISALADKSRLSYVSIGETAVTDISSLAGKPALDWLALAQSPVADLSPLRTASRLDHLVLDNTRVTDLSPLHGLPLTYLVLSHGFPKAEIEQLRRAHPELTIHFQ